MLPTLWHCMDGQPGSVMSWQLVQSETCRTTEQKEITTPTAWHNFFSFCGHAISWHLVPLMHFIIGSAKYTEHLNGWMPNSSRRNLQLLLGFFMSLRNPFHSITVTIREMWKNTYIFDINPGARIWLNMHFKHA